MSFLYWKNISPGTNSPEIVNALIECPKGTKNKYEISKNTNLVLLDRVLHSSVIYPLDYGLIPGTYADDGDPLDVLVLITNPTVPLTLLETRPIGVLLMEDEMGLDEKIIAVAIDDPYYRRLNDINDVPEHHLDEIKEFFRTYKNLEEPKYADVKEWRGKSEAHKIIINCIQSFKAKFGNVVAINPE